MKVQKLLAKGICVAMTASLVSVPYSANAAGNIIANVNYENYDTTATRIYPKSAKSDVHPDLNKGLKYYSAGNFGTESADDMYIVAEEVNRCRCYILSGNKPCIIKLHGLSVT